MNAKRNLRTQVFAVILTMVLGAAPGLAQAPTFLTEATAPADFAAVSVQANRTIDVTVLLTFS